MAGANPESSVGKVRGIFTWQRDAARVVGMYGDTNAPKIITADETVVDNTPGPNATDARAGTPVNIRLENCGINPVYWCINPGGAVGANQFNGVLNAATVQDDGTGGVMTLTGFVGKLGIAFAGASKRLATTITYAK